MERSERETRPIELGAASVETKGILPGDQDVAQGNPNAGLTDD